VPYKLVSKKPEGQATRGKTASNRLRRVDNFFLLYEPSLLTRTDDLFAKALVVDLGYGFDPRTTLESAARFRHLNHDLQILGVEIEKERVEAALPYADEKTFFRLGGFNLPLKEGEYLRLIRAFNVLRQAEEYHPSCGAGGTNLRFLRGVEAIRCRDIGDESLWIKTMVRSVCRIAGAKGIQNQFAEEVFIEGIFDLGIVNSIFTINLTALAQNFQRFSYGIILANCNSQ
jgi:hypothetical protein